MISHIQKKAVVLDTPEVMNHGGGQAGNPVSNSGIIRRKASDEGDSLTPSSHFRRNLMQHWHQTPGRFRPGREPRVTFAEVVKWQTLRGQNPYLAGSSPALRTLFNAR
jgi:hypothetical protein